MELNWSFNVITIFIAGTILLLTAILSFRSKEINKMRSIFFLRLGWNFAALFFYLEGLSYLFLDRILNLLHALSFIFPVLFMIFSINYTKSETIYSKTLIFVFGIIILYCYLAFQPDSIIFAIEGGIQTIIWTGSFLIMGTILQCVLAGYIFYWGIITWKNSPFLIKKEAFIFLIGTIIASFGSIIFYFVNLIFPPFIVLSTLSIPIGVLIFSTTLIYEPKLMYILPFTLYRISVKDHDGFLLYDHHWSESDVNEEIITGFINAVQFMSKEVIRKGDLMDINLQEGVLLIHKSNYVTVGLISSKASTLVRDALHGFTQEFESAFEKQLLANDKDMDKYKDAYFLIQKYFANFPSRMITNDLQPLLLKSKIHIPKELETKIRSVISDENEFEQIKLEIAKSPLFASKNFLKLYQELKQKDEALEYESKVEKLDFDN